VPGIFLSYRRSDTQDVARRIFDRLVEKFSRAPPPVGPPAPPPRGRAEQRAEKNRAGVHDGHSDILVRLLVAIAWPSSA
jgi:hypothetical protein